jgi:hypothetical protein
MDQRITPAGRRRNHSGWPDFVSSIISSAPWLSPFGVRSGLHSRRTTAAVDRVERQLAVAGHVGQCFAVPRLDPHLAVDDDDAGPDRGEHRFEELVHLVEVEAALAQGVVDRLQLVVGGLQFLVGRLQLPVGVLQLGEQPARWETSRPAR